MRFHQVTLRGLAVAISVGLLCCTVAQAKKPPNTGGGGGGGGAGYDLVVLAPLGANTYSSRVGDLNESGQIVGSYQDVKDNPRPFHYDVATQTYTLLSGGEIALGINSTGNIVGADWTSGEALYWHSLTAGPTTLPPLPLDTGAIASGVNNAGMVCGRSLEIIEGTPDDLYFWRGIAWQIDAAGNFGSQVELAPLPGDDISMGMWINEIDADGNALIAGYSAIRGQESSSETAVLWKVGLDTNGHLQVLSGPVGLGTIAGGYSLGYAVNNLGDVCGVSENWPFIALDGETAQALPGLDYADVGIALDLNDLGQIVGRLQVWTKRSPGFRAVLWENGQAVNLSKRVSLGRSERIDKAGQINNDGLITGHGTFLDFKSEGGAYLLIPK